MTERRRGQTDHMFLATEILEGTRVADFQPNPHGMRDENGRLIGLFSNFLQKDPDIPLSDLDTQIKKRMVMWPRGLFKTSGVIIDIIQFILCYPDIRIGFLSGSIGVAKDQLARVKSAFEEPTTRFEHTYPEFCGKRLGNQSRFTIPNRTTKMVAQPTMMVTTAKSVKAGLHFDLLYVDDLVNDQNYQSPTALETCWNDYLAVGPLVDPAGYTFVTGTPYSFGDTYERIEERAREEMKQLGRTVWSFSTRTCWKEINGKKEVLFPETKTKDGRTIGHTVHYLESERIQRGEEFFALQYECTRMSKAMQTFDEDLLNKQTVYHLNHIPQQGFTFAVGDLSYVGDDRSGHIRDKSVIFVLRATEGRLYLLDCIFGKWDSDAAAQNILFSVLKHRLSAIWIEAFLGWEAYDNIIRSMAIQRGVNRLPLEWLPLKNIAEYKKVIIGSVKSWLKQDKLKIFAGIPEFEELKTQLMRWPKLGRHDDFANCLGLACNVPHGIALERIPQSNSTMQQKINRLHFPEGDPRFIEMAQQEENYPVGKCGSGLVC
jgi:hypothetical protein